MSSVVMTFEPGTENATIVQADVHTGKPDPSSTVKLGISAQMGGYGEPVALDVALSRLQSADRDTRRTAAEAVTESRAFTDGEALRDSMRLSAAFASTRTPPASLPRDQMTTEAWFLSRWTMFWARTTHASVHSGWPLPGNLSRMTSAHSLTMRSAMGFTAVPPSGANLKPHPEEDTDQVLGIDVERGFGGMRRQGRCCSARAAAG